jgi:hypothetical protein
MSIQKARRKLNLQYASSPFQVNIQKTLRDLVTSDISVIEDQLDDQAVSQFAKQAEYEFYYPNYYPGKELHRLKKIREHYMAAKLLNLNHSDTYLDIASQYSPAPQVYERLFGCQVLRQDFEYPDGRYGRMIGGSAGKMHLDDGSITKAAMHCSLEHFEGDEDIALIKEVERVLMPGGLFVVVPFYLSDEYFAFTQPALYAELPQHNWPCFSPEETLYESKGGNRHERYYDVPHLLERIVYPTSLQIVIHSFGSSTTCTLGQMRFAAVFKRVLA